MWPADYKLIELYRSSSRVLRSSVYFKHKLETTFYSYQNGFAWFCLDTYRHTAPIQHPDQKILDYSLDAGIDCRESFQMNSNDMNSIEVHVSKNVLRDIFRFRRC